MSVRPRRHPYKENHPELCAQCGPGRLLFARDEHRPVIPAQLLDVVRLGESLDLSTQLFSTVIDALKEEEIAQGNVQRLSELLRPLPRWGLDAPRLDMS